MKKDIEKILEARNSRRGRNSHPFMLFLDKASDADKLLKVINKKIRKKSLKQEARKQYIISLVTSFEVYFKETFVLLIDNKKLNISQLKNHLNRKYDFDEVLLIKKKGITVGELAASQFNFQELENIEKAFSNLLNIDFFNKMKNFKWIFDNENKGEFIQLEDDFYLKLKSLLDLRHNFTHDINFKDFISSKEIEDLSYNLTTFVVLTEQYIADFVFKK